MLTSFEVVPFQLVLQIIEPVSFGLQPSDVPTIILQGRLGYQFSFVLPLTTQGRTEVSDRLVRISPCFIVHV